MNHLSPRINAAKHLFHMVVESLVGLPSVAIVALIFVGYFASWRHNYALMTVTIVASLFIAIRFGSPLGVLFDRPEGWTNMDVLRTVAPSLMIVGSATIGYISAYKQNLRRVVVMSCIMITSLILGW